MVTQNTQREEEGESMRVLQPKYSHRKNTQHFVKAAAGHIGKPGAQGRGHGAGGGGSHQRTANTQFVTIDKQ